MIGRSVAFELPREEADLMSDRLLEHGVLSVSVEDAFEGTDAEQPIFGEPGSNAGFWDRCRVTVMFDAVTDAGEILRRAAEALKIELPEFEISAVDDIDWVRQNRDQFQPIRISDRIWIVPSWHDAPDADATNIVLDPGAAFGTGSHPTTRLCLQWLDEHRRDVADRGVLDYGCGSGILAIAAMKLGAACAWGVDIDANAIETAAFNAEQNQVRVQFSETNRRLEVNAGITVANILSNPLKVLAPLLASHTAIGGHLILAGILDHQADDMIGIYNDWFDLSVWKREEGWSCLAGRRKRTP
jgi:ribosomal protein L11 methyltransferase